LIGGSKIDFGASQLVQNDYETRLSAREVLESRCTQKNVPTHLAPAARAYIQKLQQEKSQIELEKSQIEREKSVIEWEKSEIERENSQIKQSHSAIMSAIQQDSTLRENTNFCENVFQMLILFSFHPENGGNRCCFEANDSGSQDHPITCFSINHKCSEC